MRFDAQHPAIEFKGGKHICQTAAGLLEILAVLVEPAHARREDLQASGAERFPDLLEAGLDRFVREREFEVVALVEAEERLAVGEVDRGGIGEAPNPAPARLDGLGVDGDLGLAASVDRVEVEDLALRVTRAPDGGRTFLARIEAIPARPVRRDLEVGDADVALGDRIDGPAPERRDAPAPRVALVVGET